MPRLSALALAFFVALPAAAQYGSPPSITPLVNDPLANFHEGLKGLSFALPAGGGPTLGFNYFLSPTGALRLALGINLGLTNQPGTNFDFSVEVAYRAYMGTFGRLHPFLQPGVFFNRVQGSGGSFAIEGGVGVEYFLLERFSIAASTGIAFNIANIGNDPGVKVNLTTGNSALAANFYW